MEAVDTWEHEGIPVELHYDGDSGNPYKEWDQPSKLLVSPGVRMDIGDVESFIEDRTSDVVARYLTLCEGYLVAIPFEIETRGGQARAFLTTPDREYHADGFAVLTKEGVEMAGVPADKYEEAVRVDFEAFAQWVEGDVYGYIVAKGTPEEDSCWGFYGNEYARKEANEAAGHAATAAVERKRWERIYLLDPSA